MTAEDLNKRLYDPPFQPFRIHLSDDSSLPVLNSGMIMVGETSAILPLETGKDAYGHPLVKQWRTLAISHIVQFSDVDEMISGKGKKRN